MHKDIAFYETESQKFDIFKHFNSRIEEMKQQSQYGTFIAKKME